MVKSIKKFTKKIIFSFIKQPVNVIYSSYSQSGEDVIISNLFESMDIKKISYLNIGVCCPDFSDNTYLFYKRGSRGVCIEANPLLIENIKSIRGEDKIINIGVGNKSVNNAEFFMFDDPNLNTFDQDEAIRRDSIGESKIVDTVKISIIPINQIIEENFITCPQYMSLDIEGLDLEVLKSLDYYKYPIPVICVETCTYSDNHVKPKIPEFNNVMKEAGYFVYADTYVNTIYVNQNWFKNGGKVPS